MKLAKNRRIDWPSCSSLTAGTSLIVFGDVRSINDQRSTWKYNIESQLGMRTPDLPAKRHPNHVAGPSSCALAVVLTFSLHQISLVYECLNRTLSRPSSVPVASTCLVRSKPVQTSLPLAPFLHRLGPLVGKWSFLARDMTRCRKTGAPVRMANALCLWPTSTTLWMSRHTRYAVSPQR